MQLCMAAPLMKPSCKHVSQKPSINIWIATSAIQTRSNWAMQDFQRPQKRSLTLRGHRTSVSLEDMFWEAFKAAANDQNKTINQLASEIDEARGTDAGLASAIRLYLFSRLS